MFTAGFQLVAFQTSIGSGEPDNGWLGGGGYVRPFDEYRDRQRKLEIQEAKKELERVEREMAEAEKARLKALEDAQRVESARNAALMAAALEASLQEEINRLRMERAWLMRWIADEEAVLVLMLSSPFN
jgi:hypothetical protein